MIVSFLLRILIMALMPGRLSAALDDEIVILPLSSIGFSVFLGPLLIVMYVLCEFFLMTTDRSADI